MGISVKCVLSKYNFLGLLSRTGLTNMHSLEIVISLMGKNWTAYPFSQKVLVISCGRKEVGENPSYPLPQFPVLFSVA